MTEPKTILLVEDEPLLAVSETKVLRKEGYEVLLASSGEEAIARVDAAPQAIALILMAIDLGAEMDGIRAAQEILKTHDIPIVFLSSHTEPEVVSRAASAASYGYVVKSSGIAVLTASIKMALNLHAARQAQQRAGAALWATFESLGDGFFACDAEWRFVYVNAPAERILGIRSEEVIGKIHWDVFPLTLGTDLEKEYRRAAAGEVRDFENYYAPWDRWFHNRCFPSGGGMSVYFEDITTRKQAELALQRANEALERRVAEMRENEEKYRLLAETSNALISEIDPAGKFLYVNAKHKEVLGYEDDEIIGHYAFEFGSPAAEQKARQRLEKSLTDEKMQSNEWLFKDKQGNWKWFNCYSSSYVDSKGETHITVYSFDITERKQAEKALQQALADKDVLMHELQHRVKNSLTVAASLLNLEERNLADERARAIFAGTRFRLQSMAAVYEQLYHTGGIDRVDLSEYIQYLAAGLSRSYLPDAGAVSIETQLEEMEMDLRQALPLGLILTELITNALKHAFPAGRAPQGGPGVIRIEFSQTAGQGNLCIADNGVGLQSQNPNRSGSGMGLELVELLARQIGGEFTAESGAGYTARVTFPLK